MRRVREMERKSEGDDRERVRRGVVAKNEGVVGGKMTRATTMSDPNAAHADDLITASESSARVSGADQPCCGQEACPNCSAGGAVWPSRSKSCGRLAFTGTLTRLHVDLYVADILDHVKCTPNIFTVCKCVLFVERHHLRGCGDLSAEVFLVTPRSHLRCVVELEGFTRKRHAAAAVWDYSHAPLRCSLPWRPS